MDAENLSRSATTVSSSSSQPPQRWLLINKLFSDIYTTFKFHYISLTSFPFQIFSFPRFPNTLSSTDHKYHLLITNIINIRLITVKRQLFTNCWQSEAVVHRRSDSGTLVLVRSRWQLSASAWWLSLTLAADYWMPTSRVDRHLLTAAPPDETRRHCAVTGMLRK